MTGFKTPKNIDEAYAMAAAAKPELDRIGQAIADSIGCEFIAAPLKSRERAEQKLNTKYRGDMTQLNDLARCRIICDTLEQAAMIQKAVHEKMTPAREVDRLETPNERGYRDLKFVLPVNGTLVEMQVQLRDFAAADKITHVQYEKIRELTAAAKDRPLTEREQKEISIREKLCQRTYRNAALAYNARTTGKKLKMADDRTVALKKREIER